MSTYNGRRAPNVSQYLANLNHIPSAQDLSAQSDFTIGDDDLDFLTNAEFLDFDSYQDDGAFPPPPAPQQPQATDMAPQPQQPQQQQQQKAGGNGGMGMSGPQYQFGEFQTYPSLAGSPTSLSSSNHLQGAYPPQPPHPLALPQAQPGDKRKASSAHLPSTADLEEASRMAAEEDKRRRNTAASARFRVKKKQREQELEKKTKEMQDKVNSLETKVMQLEMENKWLKGLITAKGKDAEASMEKTVVEREEEERSTEGRTDGVGTAEDLKPAVVA